MMEISRATRVRNNSKKKKGEKVWEKENKRWREKNI